MIDRRTLMLSGMGSAVLAATCNFAAGAAGFDPTPGAWRKFAITTRLDLTAGQTQAWVPLPSISEDGWISALQNDFQSNAATSKIVRNQTADLLHLAWTPSEPKPFAEVKSVFAVRDRAVDLTRPDPSVAPLSADERKLYLSASEKVPLDGMVGQLSARIVAGHTIDLAKARAIYEWMVENTYRRASTRGCGTGDVAALLRSGDFGGKCADLNALFVGLLRAAGIPARDIYGIRVAPSKFGYRSLGANAAVVTGAQHCRADVYLAGFGWVPADPADVRKVMLEEPPGGLKIDDAKVAAARETLFGAWEGNWLGYNAVHDVVLPGAAEPRLDFLMYPQAELNGQRLDCLDPDKFRYTIKSEEVSA